MGRSCSAIGIRTDRTTSGNRGFPRRIQSNAFLEVDHRRSDIDFLITGQAWTDGCRYSRRHRWFSKDVFCRMPSSDNSRSRQAYEKDGDFVSRTAWSRGGGIKSSAGPRLRNSYTPSCHQTPYWKTQTMTHRWRRHVQRASQLLAAAALVGAATIAVSELAAAPQAKSVWDGVYTEQQAARGAITFSASCARCHSSEPNGGEEGRRLAGDHFWQSFRESTVDHLLDFVSKNMPNGAGGTLSANNYADVVAYILSRNGLPAGSAELTKDSAAGVQIIAKDGPGELPNGTLVQVVGCVARKEGGGWILNRATAPVRTQPSDTGADDVARPLGDRSYALMFLLTPLDRYRGSPHESSRIAHRRRRPQRHQCVGNSIARRVLPVNSSGDERMQLSSPESLFPAQHRPPR